MARPRSPRHRKGTDGRWRMDGYGTVSSLDGDTLQEFPTTSVSCLKGDSARRTGPGTYATADGTTLTVRPGPGANRATLGRGTTPSSPRRASTGRP
ncbi:hypothetical protein ACFYMI_12315 [Streptomyces collinus]|uniref:hypothetical protein n=1 Tax=Streptomyces collinus TaxID=42684 RepID=UPI003677540A